jgi:leucyl-tRNA synthetase
VAESCDWKFNFEKVKILSNKFIVLGDAGFRTIFEKDLRNLAGYVGGDLILVQPADRHFTAAEEPSIKSLLEQSGWIPVPEGQLPLELPKVKHYEPSGTGESPLATIEKWVNTTCPACGGPAKRETNTMPQWAGSCWYYLAYCMPRPPLSLPLTKGEKQRGYVWDKEKINYWNPVDLYVGGAEHATRHLIYARFWHKFLYDIGAVNNSEPFTKLQNVGLILAEDGRKMSKRWGNVINPDDIVDKYGADSMRLYEMFMGPFDQPCAWSTNGVVGCRRFLERVWYLQEKIEENVELAPKLMTLIHQTVKKVSEDIPAMRYNTAVAKMMELVNELSKEEKLDKKHYSLLLRVLSPFAPHITEEIWSVLGNKKSIFESAWPEYDVELAKDTEITLVVQINGKVRDSLVVSADISEEEAKNLALNSEIVKKWLGDKEPKKVIYVKGKLISIVV